MALLGKKNDAKDDKPAMPAGMTRKGASSAKPARAAAQSVRAASPKSSGRKANPATMTKEEKKEQRRKDRDARDRQVVVSNILLKASPNYKKMRRIWWVGLGVGLAFTAVAWMCMFVFPGASSDLGTPMGLVAMVTLILAYVFIIGSFIFDWIKIRPIRRAADATVAGLSEKRMQQIIDQDYEAEELARAAKEKAKKSK